jgi:hypothetical protein
VRQTGVMRRGKRDRAATDPDALVDRVDPASGKLAEAAAAGQARFRALPARTRPEDMTTSQDEAQVPLAETDPNRDSALRWGLGGL